MQNAHITLSTQINPNHKIQNKESLIIITFEQFAINIQTKNCGEETYIFKIVVLQFRYIIG